MNYQELIDFIQTIGDEMQMSTIARAIVEALGEYRAKDVSDFIQRQIERQKV